MFHGRRSRQFWLLIALAAAGLSLTIAVPALGGPQALSAASPMTVAKRALSSAKRAEAKADQALRMRQARGPAGPGGPAGAAGAQGPAGAPGAQGPAGVLRGRIARPGDVTLPANPNLPVRVTHLDSLPAGSWILMSTGTVNYFGTGGRQTIVDCQIKANGVRLAAQDVHSGATAGSSRLHALSIVTGFTATQPYTASLDCFQAADLSSEDPALRPRIADTTLTAIQVHELDIQAVTG